MSTEILELRGLERFIVDAWWSFTRVADFGQLGTRDILWVRNPKSRKKLNKILREEYDAKYILPKVKDPYIRFDSPEGKTLFLLRWS